MKAAKNTAAMALAQQRFDVLPIRRALYSRSGGRCGDVGKWPAMMQRSPANVVGHQFRLD